MKPHCPTCGCPVRVEGRTTKYYVPQPELKSRSQIKRVMVQAPAEVIVEIELLRDKLKIAVEALEYYSHHDHYETRITLNHPGTKIPGVLIEQGSKARTALARIRGEK